MLKRFAADVAGGLGSGLRGFAGHATNVLDLAAVALAVSAAAVAVGTWAALAAASIGCAVLSLGLERRR